MRPPGTMFRRRRQAFLHLLDELLEAQMCPMGGGRIDLSPETVQADSDCHGDCCDARYIMDLT